MALSLTETEIIGKLNHFAKNERVPIEIEDFIRAHTVYFNRAAFYLKQVNDRSDYYIDIEEKLAIELKVLGGGRFKLIKSEGIAISLINTWRSRKNPSTLEWSCRKSLIWNCLKR
jgi:hypothetical protein